MALQSKSAVHRWFRKLLIVVITIFALIGLVSSYSVFNSSPRVGQFRTAAGRNLYLASYDEAFKALPEPTKTHDLSTDFGTVRVYEWSDSANANSIPVVLVPGRSSGVPMWSDNLDYLIKNHRVIAFDSLGDAGLSVQSAPMENVSDLATWMDQVITQLAPAGAHIVGHSFGGAIAANYAKEYPGHIRSLTLLEPVFTFGYPPASLMGWVLLASIPGIPKSWREHALGKVGGTSFDGDNAMARMIELGSTYYSASLPTPQKLTEETAQQLTMPVYVALASTDSLAGGNKTAERAQQLIPHAQVQVWPNTTHSLPMQVAEPLSKELDQFWQEAESYDD